MEPEHAQTSHGPTSRAHAHKGREVLIFVGVLFLAVVIALVVRLMNGDDAQPTAPGVPVDSPTSLVQGS